MRVHNIYSRRQKRKQRRRAGQQATTKRNVEPTGSTGTTFAFPTFLTVCWAPTQPDQPDQPGRLSIFYLFPGHFYSVCWKHLKTKERQYLTIVSRIWILKMMKRRLQAWSQSMLRRIWRRRRWHFPQWTKCFMSKSTVFWRLVKNTFELLFQPTDWFSSGAFLPLCTTLSVPGNERSQVRTSRLQSYGLGIGYLASTCFLSKFSGGFGCGLGSSPFYLRMKWVFCHLPSSLMFAPSWSNKPLSNTILFSRPLQPSTVGEEFGGWSLANRCQRK